jgi:TPR repeat protein
MLFRPRLVPTATLLALLALTACRRPGPSLADDHPGIDPKPAGQALSDKAPMTDPERSVIDLSRPESPGRSFDPSSEDDVAYKAAMRGEAWAQTKVGKSYVTALDDPERFQQGLDFLRRAAEENDAEAIYLLATMTAAGTGVEQSNIEAFAQMKRAAELGFADAQYELAAMYSEGRGTIVDTGAAAQWARIAAAQDHPAAQHAVGVNLLRNAASSLEVSEGLAYLERAAAKNHREALMVFAGILTRGEFGLKKDQARAEKLLRPRADNGDAEFQFGLGTLYLYGDQLLDKQEEGMRLINESAKAGFQQSKDLLAKIASEAAAPGQ